MMGPSNQQKNYDTTITCRNERKHSRRFSRDGRRHRRGTNGPGDGDGSRTQSRCLYANPCAWDSSHRFYRGDRFLCVVPSRSLMSPTERVTAPGASIMNLIIAAAAGRFSETLHDTAETFGWNWQLFLSQVISFVIVALLLRRFAYKPILAVLEERRRKIEEGQLNAEKIKKELAEAEKRYQEIIAKADADAQKMI